MFRFIGLCLGTLVRLLRARRSLLLENLALRQQLAVLKRRHPRPRLDLLDKLFWVAVRRFWSGWQQSLIVVTPETVGRWHRDGFRSINNSHNEDRNPSHAVHLHKSTKSRVDGPYCPNKRGGEIALLQIHAAEEAWSI